MKKYLKTSERREQILALACEAATAGHFRQVSRAEIAEKAGTATGNINRVFGTMDQLRSDLIAYAIKHEKLVVIAQAILDKHPGVEGLDDDLRLAAFSSLL